MATQDPDPEAESGAGAGAVPRPAFNTGHGTGAVPEAARPVVAVTVVRSGGFAGIPRRWSVQAPPSDADRWIALVEGCPWDEDADDGAHGAARIDGRGADRFSWSVRARLAQRERRAELTESQAAGPWRTLIDAVRDAAPPPPTR
ncbi:protealysin inhibitor emfourin [Microbacterium sp.]|uniref:protealysin inhibitor emfourin n=1 Tax=Microbacterium sp. TaxID=51671 RepID=UPI003C758DD9